jgi:hypothetical protein
MKESGVTSMNQKYRNPKQLSVWKSMRIEHFTRLASTPIPIPLIGGLAIVLGSVVYGFILLRQDPGAFHIWIREDGLAEWLTFVELSMMFIYSFTVSFSFEHCSETKAARRAWFFLGLLFLFGAMEEISWGQRILGIESPEWFMRHNRQSEINIHNLVIYGKNLNKLVFGKLLTIIILIYIVVMPLLYRTNKRMKEFINRWAIPIAQNYQVLLFIIITIAIRMHLNLSKKIGELLEFSVCYIIFLILVHPYNREIIPFKKGSAFVRKASSDEGKGEGS